MGRPVALAVALLLLPSAPARAVEVISVAHSPSNAQNRFTLQCGRSGLMRTSLLLDAGSEVPTDVLGAVEVAGRLTALQRRRYESGPAYDAKAKKVGGKGNRWLLSDVFTWQFTCRADCREIQAGDQRFASSALEFRFVAGREGIPRPEEPPRFEPRSTAESEVLTLRCQPATPLPAR